MNQVRSVSHISLPLYSVVNVTEKQNGAVIVQASANAPLALPQWDARGRQIAPKNLRPVSELPPKYRPLFSRTFRHFNVLQSELFDVLTKTDKHLAVAAPTASGKTVLMELGIVRMLAEVEAANRLSGLAKVIYMAPLKAICNERFKEWREKFSALNLNVQLLTGDSSVEEASDAELADIIITTPEKWDTMTRRLKSDSARLIDMIQLCLVDEVHMIGDDARGATLETVVNYFSRPFF